MMIKTSYKTIIIHLYGQNKLTFLVDEDGDEGVIKHSIIWTPMITPIVIIIGRPDTFPEYLN